MKWCCFFLLLLSPLYGGDYVIEQVEVFDEGVFLLVNGVWLCGEEMQASSDGVFVSIEGTWMRLEEALRQQSAMEPA